MNNHNIQSFGRVSVSHYSENTSRLKHDSISPPHHPVSLLNGVPTLHMSQTFLNQDQDATDKSGRTSKNSYRKQATLPQ